MDGTRRGLKDAAVSAAVVIDLRPHSTDEVCSTQPALVVAAAPAVPGLSGAARDALVDLAVASGVPAAWLAAVAPISVMDELASRDLVVVQGAGTPDVYVAPSPGGVGAALEAETPAVSRITRILRLIDRITALPNQARSELQVAYLTGLRASTGQPVHVEELHQAVSYYRRVGRRADALGLARSVDPTANPQVGLYCGSVLQELDARDDARIVLDQVLSSPKPWTAETATAALKRAEYAVWQEADFSLAHALTTRARACLGTGELAELAGVLTATIELLGGDNLAAVDTVAPLLPETVTSETRWMPANLDGSLNIRDLARLDASFVAASAAAVMGRHESAVAIARYGSEGRRRAHDQTFLATNAIHVLASALAVGEHGDLLAHAGPLAVAIQTGMPAASLVEAAWLHLAACRLHMAGGDAAALERAGLEAYRGFLEAKYPGPTRWAIAAATMGAALRNDVPAVSAHRALLAATCHLALPFLEPDVIRARAWAEAVVDRPSAAFDRLIEAAELARKLGAHSLAVSALHDLARLGAPDVAFQRWDELVGGACGGPAAQARRADVLAIASGDAIALLDCALDFARLGLRLEAAESACRAAVAARRRKDRGTDRRATQLAGEQRAMAHGAATPALALLETVSLTRREEEVANLSAQGLSSRQAAERLGLSSRTVENTLQRAFEKLGVRSRVELAALLSGRRSDSTATPW